MKTNHRFYPKAPCCVHEGDTVVFLAHRRWFDFLFPKRRNRPFHLGEAVVKMVDPVMEQVWYQDPIPPLVMRGDYMMVQSSVFNLTYWNAKNLPDEALGLKRA